MTQSPDDRRPSDPDCAIPGTPLAGAARGTRRVRPLRILPSGVPDVSDARGRERQSARTHRAHARAARRHARHVERERARRTSTVASAAARARRCVRPACRTDILLEATRATLAEHRPLPRVARVILSTFERPRLLGLAMFGGRVLRAHGIARLLSRLPGRIGFSMAMLSSTSRRFPPRQRARAAVNERAGDRGRVALLTGCVMEGLFAETNRATERVLSANGYAVADAPGQGCCGALHAHAGDADGARRLARRNIAAFERAAVDFICVNAAGCGAMMKEYAQLLADDPEWRERADRFAAKVRDVSRARRRRGPAPGRSRADEGRLRRALPSAPRAACVEPAARRACAPFQGSSSCRSPRARCAAEAPGSTTW